ncbi:hypothetical protein GF318_05160 [Candidatus Micrarchaeota archaeon]|nr:hypothetical protein [Candidatus Micrarchaeota archaeon]
MAIRTKEKNFVKYLEKHFGMALPKNTAVFYARGVRAGNRKIRNSKIHGELGYAACDAGFNPTNSFIQNFGHLAKKNIVRLDREEGLLFASGSGLAMDLGTKSKYVVIMMKQHVLGLGYYDSGKRVVVNKIPGKRTRRIVNEI